MFKKKCFLRSRSQKCLLLFLWYIYVTAYGEYLEISEKLNLSIMDVVTQSGSSFALPSQTTYLESGQGFDKELTRVGESQMKD